jgi:hypothetical protein
MLAKNIPDILDISPPASGEKIDNLERILQLQLPDEYRALLREANGIYANLVSIFSCEDAPERNETYEVREYAPGYILIGAVSDSPVLLKSGKESPVYVNDWGAMTPDCMVELAPSLESWVNAGCPDSEGVESG